MLGLTYCISIAHNGVLYLHFVLTYVSDFDPVTESHCFTSFAIEVLFRMVIEVAVL
jgi:hypothetical protein